MKNTVLTILIITLSFFLNSQEIKKVDFENAPNQQETIFDNPTAVGGFLGMNTLFTEINKQEAMLVGGSVNMVLNHGFNIGFEGYGMVSDVKSPNINPITNRPYQLQMGYGGLKLEPVIASKKMVHITIPILLGAGGLGESNDHFLNYDPDDPDHHDYHIRNTDFFFVAQPGINVEANLFKNMRVAVGANYRKLSNLDLGEIRNEDMEGFSGTLSLRFGWF